MSPNDHAERPLADLRHRGNVCAIQRVSDGKFWECNAEHGSGWTERIRQAWTYREAFQMCLQGYLTFNQLDDIRIVELVPRRPPMTDHAEKMREALLPCPWCGAAGEIVDADNADDWLIVRCSDSCEMSPEYDDNDRERMVRLWNRRAPVLAELRSFQRGWEEIEAALGRTDEERARVDLVHHVPAMKRELDELRAENERLRKERDEYRMRAESAEVAQVRDARDPVGSIQIERLRGLLARENRAIIALEADLAALQDVRDKAEAICEAFWPADIVTGESGDRGARMIVALRAALAAAPKREGA